MRTLKVIAGNAIRLTQLRFESKRLSRIKLTTDHNEPTSAKMRPYIKLGKIHSPIVGKKEG